MTDNISNESNSWDYEKFTVLKHICSIDTYGWNQNSSQATNFHRVEKLLSAVASRVMLISWNLIYAAICVQLFSTHCTVCRNFMLVSLDEVDKSSFRNLSPKSVSVLYKGYCITDFIIHIIGVHNNWEEVIWFIGLFSGLHLENRIICLCIGF